MKLVVTIPAHNEEKSLADVIFAIPQNIADIDEIKVVVVDDGSVDHTAQIAANAGAILISHSVKRGLAKTFQDAIDEGLKNGADIIVNIDADGQYDAGEIPLLVKTLLETKADLVVGDRQVRRLKHMPFLKKYGNVIGSFFLRLTTGLKVHDASSGFRAFTRETALRTQILSSHTYTHESLIQAAFWGLKVVNVPVSFYSRNHGQSKLIDGIFSHIWKSLGTILRSLATYKPFTKFVTLGFLAIFASLFFGMMLILLGFIADLVVGNRRIQGEILYRLKKEQYDLK